MAAKATRSVITGTGACIPSVIRQNKEFLSQVFYDAKGKEVTISPHETIKKFQEITGISERRYVDDSLNASDIGAIAGRLAIEDSGIDRETIDQIIVSHNFGDVNSKTIQMDAVPSLASRIKQKLAISNPGCIAYDILYGCPGWLQSLIHTDAFFTAGIAKKILLIGTETLSRVIDISDRDSMIFADGAGACVVESKPGGENMPGILSTSAQTHSGEETNYINMGKSYMPGSDERIRFIKMLGRKVYEYAMTYVPAAMKDCLDKSNTPVERLRKIFIHQANNKMDESIVTRFYQLYGLTDIPDDIMPMSIQWLGNSSVATIPTLFDLVRKNQVPGYQLSPGDIILFASVGAGMNINAVCYRY